MDQTHMHMIIHQCGQLFPSSSCQFFLKHILIDLAFRRKPSHLSILLRAHYILRSTSHCFITLWSLKAQLWTWRILCCSLAWLCSNGDSWRWYCFRAWNKGGGLQQMVSVEKTVNFKKHFTPPFIRLSFFFKKILMHPPILWILFQLPIVS